tara:strand:+ start:3506 stop:3934 length:429 start_codon:yes stop_codon:yes gene_type:complete
MAVKKGDKVKIDYTGTFEDGTVFDSSEKHGKPLEFEVGSGNIIKGLDNAIVGMEKGIEKDVKIPPAEAYGDHNPSMLKKVPKAQFPPDKEVKAGMMLRLQSPDGQQIPVKVAEVTETEVTLDLNHPLAGKTLNFKVKVVELA